MENDDNTQDEMTPEEKAMLEGLDGNTDAVDAAMAEKADQIAKEAEAARKVEVTPVEMPQVEETANTVASNADAENLNLGIILDIPIDVHVELGRTCVSVREILQLGSGSIIELDRLAGQPADIIVNGKLIGQGDIVVINENFGVRMTRLVDPEERIESL